MQLQVDCSQPSTASGKRHFAQTAKNPWWINFMTIGESKLENKVSEISRNSWTNWIDNTWTPDCLRLEMSRVNHLWLGFGLCKFPLKTSIFSIFTLQVKKSCRFKKYPGQRQVGLLFTADQK